MKKVYLVGKLNKKLQILPGIYAKAEDHELGVIGMLPAFSSKRKAEQFCRGTKFPIITMQIEKGAE
jgi:hypothetical protein